MSNTFGPGVQAEHDSSMDSDVIANLVNELILWGFVYKFGVVVKSLIPLITGIQKKRRSLDITAQSTDLGLKLISRDFGYYHILNLVVETTGVSIPGELLLQILFKQPVKSLLRFKAVSRPWKLLIESDVFIHKHLHRPNPKLLGYSAQLDPKLGNILPRPICDVVGACNGILCVCVSFYPKSLILCNPATREFAFVPHSPYYCHFAVFCYLPKSQEYQIVLFEYLPYSRIQVDVTTLTLGKTPSSRVAKNITMPGKITNRCTATGGTTMYWLGLDGHREIVICYDVVEGRFSEMSFPPYPFPLEGVHKSVRVFKGSVIMFVSPIEKTFDMWMLVDDVSDGKSWYKYRTVGPLDRVVYPVEVCWDSRWILCRNTRSSLIKDYISKNLFYYDLETDQLVDYCDFQQGLVKDYKDTDPPIMEFVNYVESFVRIDSLVPYVDTNIP